MIVSKKRMLHLANEVMNGLDKLDANPEVKAVIQLNGYSNEALTAIRELCTNAVTFYNSKQVQDDNKKGMFASLKAKRTTLQKHVVALIQALRDAHEDDPGILKTYGVVNSPPKSVYTLLEYARNLYAKVLEDIANEKLLLFGIDNENVQVGVTLIGEIEELTKRYQDLKSNKEYSTAERNRIFRKLKKVWKAFERKCKDLFYDTPHMLEGIISVPCSGFKRRYTKSESEEPENTDTTDTPEETEDTAEEEVPVESVENGDVFKINLKGG